MTHESHPPNPLVDLEEAAEGHDLFRTPGRHLMIEEAREAAEESRWLPSETTEGWPAANTRRQITERRLDLYEAMQRLEAAAARSTSQPDWVDGMRESLQNLDEALEHHVTEIESDNGLFDEVMERSPHLAPDIEMLRVEHDQLTSHCRAALDRASAHDPDRGELRRRALSILGRIAMHRQSGAELLYDAFNIDLSVGD